MASPYAVILRQPTADDLWRARLRVWGAEVRDRQPPHRDAAPDAVFAAGLLCRVLDDLDALGPRRAEKCGLKKTCGQLLEKLRLLRVRPPAAHYPLPETAPAPAGSIVTGN
jgi:hypothetical protein